MLKSRRGRTTQKSPIFRASRALLQGQLKQLSSRISIDPESKIQKTKHPKNPIFQIFQYLPTDQLFRVTSSGFFPNPNRPKWRKTPNQNPSNPILRNPSVSPKIAPPTPFSATLRTFWDRPRLQKLEEDVPSNPSRLPGASSSGERGRKLQQTTDQNRHFWLGLKRSFSEFRLSNWPTSCFRLFVFYYI